MSTGPNQDSTNALLTGCDGVLVSVSIDVNPRDLEFALEVLAEFDFHINPQIYHNAAFVYFYADGSERTESTTLVEFAAYSGQIDRLCSGLECAGFQRSRVAVTDMLDALHSDERLEPGSPGTGYRVRLRRKHMAAAHAAFR